jgi:hypothetical protein
MSRDGSVGLVNGYEPGDQGSITTRGYTHHHYVQTDYKAYTI